MTGPYTALKKEKGDPHDTNTIVRNYLHFTQLVNPKILSGRNNIPKNLDFIW
jgi:hypothetical protein